MAINPKYLPIIQRHILIKYLWVSKEDSLIRMLCLSSLYSQSSSNLFLQTQFYTDCTQLFFPNCWAALREEHPLSVLTENRTMTRHSHMLAFYIIPKENLNSSKIIPVLDALKRQTWISLTVYESWMMEEFPFQKQCTLSLTYISFVIDQSLRFTGWIVPSEPKSP